MGRTVTVVVSLALTSGSSAATMDPMVGTPLSVLLLI